MRFSNHVCVVTGSSRGIGAHIARRFAADGAAVVLNGRGATRTSLEQLDALRDEIQGAGGRAAVAPADISGRAGVEQLVSSAQDSFGRLDYLILNAARAPIKNYDRLLERDLRQLVETNFIGNILCIKNALPMLEKSGGSIVFVSSLGSRVALPEYPLGSIKAAMEAVIRDLSVMLDGRGVSANAVCGGLVKTDSIKTLRQVWPGVETLDDEAWVSADEITDVIMFLCSHAARGIQGQTIVVDRGLTNRLRGF
ncbi:MAG: short-chain dehydrogenase [Acidobacteria bacterium]|nr:MAG: short-chain dehydrogenase [Acidobacteriota bacterium]